MMVIKVPAWLGPAIVVWVCAMVVLGFYLGGLLLGAPV